ncbi:response regulator [Marinomonas balearica]|uniref:Two-component system chemotaxis response regulator CheY n=1 Tax=Marinomonas balearica TaxID=491947 RepID=A0A4R6MBR1_9GAMM|nr:response regulator [Marinomonas balearica]TDO99058.1 two-component system chemotaxis response regulator CheY [Marinomonas balearica]
MKLIADAQELSIILIEPSKAQQKIILNALHESGVTDIDVAENVASASNTLTMHTPDLVISSMYLEDGTANDIIDFIRSTPSTSDVPFMLISSERKRESLEHLRQNGLLAVLPKPFSSDDLDTAIKATLDLNNEEEIELEFFDPRELKVLIADDSNMAQKHISRTLQSMGIMYIDRADDGRAALALLEEKQYDLIITDYNMPEMNGIELANHIKNSPAHSHIPVLMVSSDADTPQLSNVTKGEVDALCDKTFTPNTIKSLLHNLLG